MALTWYKRDQGYWTRSMSLLGWGVVVLGGAAWLWAQLARLPIPTNDAGEPAFPLLYLQAGLAGLLVLIGGFMLFYLVYFKPSTSEFLISTEGEMKKVNWSSRREIFGSTWVVIIASVSIAFMLFAADFLFLWFFRSVGVLL